MTMMASTGRILWLRGGAAGEAGSGGTGKGKRGSGRVIVAERKPICKKCRKRLAPEMWRCPICGSQVAARPDSSRPDAEQTGSDEVQVRVIGRHRELSVLTELQKRILVAALAADRQRTVRALASGFREGIGVEVGAERFAGREALESVTALVTGGYFARTEQPWLGLTFRGQLLAEMASDRRRA